MGCKKKILLFIRTLYHQYRNVESRWFNNPSQDCVVRYWEEFKCQYLLDISFVLEMLKLGEPLSQLCWTRAQPQWIKWLIHVVLYSLHWVWTHPISQISMNVQKMSTGPSLQAVFFCLLEWGGEKEVLPESRQVFEDGADWTSRQINLVFPRQTGFIESEHPFIINRWS